jgi:uridine kinase
VGVEAYESVSSWKQPVPAPASSTRNDLIGSIARRIISIRADRIRVIVDGYTASGKTSFAHELAAAVRRHGRSTMRASFDDFKKPWRDSREKGYDRSSGEGYYRNAPDFESARELLLKPAGRDGSGTVVLCAHDPLTGEDLRHVAVDVPVDAVLIVDSVFGMRREYDEFWDFRIWIDVPQELALERGIARDAPTEGQAEAERLHRDRYQIGERIYFDEVGPTARADVIIDNTDYANPIVVATRR